MQKRTRGYILGENKWISRHREARKGEACLYPRMGRQTQVDLLFLPSLPPPVLITV